ncbi:MAG TPA: branched-chain amino acid ABC transporter ATP-binding protein/permease [Methylomirabilota bacterium]|jgi:branched-chain amino acid transport system permease protein|nr:branched-chain amino acid ABC transporter ATP-binding protein/permease [Methylomirabilota bacterium]
MRWPPTRGLGPPVAVGALGLALAVLPALKVPAFYESFLYLVFHWVALATSWTILSGFSGYFSFGHGAFFGAGMYTTATLAAGWGVPFFLTLPPAGLLAALFGMGVGAVVFRVRRLRGELFALLTLAVTFVLATIVLNTRIDGGPGVYLSGVPLPRVAGSATATLYLLGLGVALGSIATAYAVVRARWGVGLFAIHDDEDVAEVMGVPTYRYKLVALGLSSGLAGVAGGIHAMFVTYVTVAETFSIVVPLYVVLMSVLGGARHWLGPAVGATLITVLMYAFTSGETAVVGRALVGLTLMLVILFLPNGITGLVARGHPPRPAARAPARSPDGPSRPAPPPASAPPLLVCRDVRKAFRGVRALAGVSLDVREGEILGLVGPNGSGKSTLINVVSGHYRPDGGGIRFDGVELAGRAAHRIAGLGIARTYQIPRPFARLTVRNNVAVAGMFGRTGHDRRTAEREAARWLEFTGLADRAEALPGALNLHQRKFLELARALASEPRLVLLDEVLSGLTASEMADAARLVRQIRDRGATVVFVEHIIRAVLDLSDRVVVLNYGQVIASGAPHDVMRHPDVVRAYLGKAYA